MISAVIDSGQSDDPPKTNQTNDTPQPSVKESSTMNEKESFHECHDGDDNDASINSNKNSGANSGSLSSTPLSEYLMIVAFIASLLIGIAFVYRNSIKNIFNKHINEKTTQEIQISK